MWVASGYGEAGESDAKEERMAVAAMAFCKDEIRGELGEMPMKCVWVDVDVDPPFEVECVDGKVVDAE